MFTTTSRRSLTAATAALALAAGLAVGTASSASAEPAPPVSGDYTTTTFTAPAQLASPGNSILIESILYQPLGMSWRDYSGWVSCQGGTWARLNISTYPEPGKAWVRTELPASDSGKSCSMTIATNRPTAKVFFQAGGITMNYVQDGHPKVTVESKVILQSSNGGL